MHHLPASNNDHLPTLPVADGSRMTAARHDGFSQMLEQIDTKHDEGHKRLRHDLDRHEEQVTHDLKRLEDQLNKGLETLREGRQANSARIEKLETAPLDATKLVLNSRVVVSLVIIALAIAASVWGLRSAISDLASKMDTTYKLQEMQNGAMKNSIDDMKRRQELQQYEIQGLKDLMRDGFAGKSAKEKTP